MKFKPTQDYYWSTEYYHPDNAFTMNDFLTHHFPDGFEVLTQDESYCEIKDLSRGLIYALDAKGNGDSFNHIVTSGLLTD